MPARLSLALLIAILGSSQAVSADCIGLPTTQRVKDATAVFQGIVRSATGDVRQTVSIDVERVWKGDLDKHVVVFNLVSAEGLSLRPGQSYVFFTTPWRDDATGLPGPQPSPGQLFLQSACGNATPTREAERDGLIRELGTSRVPR